MQPLVVLVDPTKIFIADTSVVINIIASGRATEIIEAIPNGFIVTEEVVSELKFDRNKSHRDVRQLDDLIERDLVKVVSMGEVAVDQFEKLVTGITSNTLDDGEAATIASALERGGVALIDERKARRFCDERYPDLSYGCTVDIFMCSEVREVLGEAGLTLSVFNALQNANMHVPPEHEEWVINLIGIDRARECSSLNRAVRRWDGDL